MALDTLAGAKRDDNLRGTLAFILVSATSLAFTQPEADQTSRRDANFPLSACFVDNDLFKTVSLENHLVQVIPIEKAQDAGCPPVTRAIQAAYDGLKLQHMAGEAICFPQRGGFRCPLNDWFSWTLQGCNAYCNSPWPKGTLAF